MQSNIDSVLTSGTNFNFNVACCKNSLHGIFILFSEKIQREINDITYLGGNINSEADRFEEVRNTVMKAMTTAQQRPVTA